MGFVDYGQVLSLVAALDLFVMPSRNEGLGLALIEAMALGLPIISTNVGGIPYLLEHEKTGLLIEKGTWKCWDLWASLIGSWAKILSPFLTQT